MKFAYLVKCSKGMQILFNKKSAIQLAKENNGKIRFMSYALYNYPSCHGDITTGWDYPTFYVQSQELVF
jgi:hypothetical protein